MGGASCQTVSLTVPQRRGARAENLVNMDTCFMPLSTPAFENPSDLGRIPVVISVAVLVSVLCIQLPKNACMDLICTAGMMIPVC